jgi:hypothetical protein
MPFWVRTYLAAANAYLGRELQVREMAGHVLQAVPNFSADRFVEKEPYERAEHRSALREGLRASGLPD